MMGDYLSPKAKASTKGRQKKAPVESPNLTVAKPSHIPEEVKTNPKWRACRWYVEQGLLDAGRSFEAGLLATWAYQHSQLLEGADLLGIELYDSKYNPDPGRSLYGIICAMKRAAVDLDEIIELMDHLNNRRRHGEPEPQPGQSAVAQ